MKTVYLFLTLGLGTLTFAYDFVMPDVELHVRVIETNGSPVAGAQAGAFFPHVYGAGASVKGESKKALTDDEGKATLLARTASSVGGGAQKDGYYRTQFEEADFMQMREDGKPLKAEREIVLKKIMNPIPLVARQFPELIVPRENEPYGFDFEVGDWVAPRGRGKHTDIIFNITGNYTSYKEFDAVLEIAFPNEGDGLVRFDGEQNIGSELISDYHAPETGYIPSLKLSKRAAAGQTTSQWLEESKPGSNYYFRVRTVLDDKRNVVTAHYGKLYGRFEFGRYKKAESLYIKSGTSYFNPTANDRNVEFDRNRNLAADLSASKKVTLP